MCASTARPIDPPRARIPSLPPQGDGWGVGATTVTVHRLLHKATIRGFVIRQIWNEITFRSRP